MIILHLTDFHFKSESDLQIKVVDSIIKKIKQEEIKPDFVFFTGDLVQSGTKEENFKKASESLFTRISKALEIPLGNFILCPGNHDINRVTIHKGVKSYFQTDVTDNEKLDNFYTKKDEVFASSIVPLENYNNFIKQFYNGQDDLDINDLYTIFFKSLHSKSIAIVALNSAWLSTGDDYSNLFIPLSLLKEVNLKLSKKQIDCKIVLFHHPLHFFKEFNFYEVEAYIHKNFDLMFTGHIHKSQSSTHFLGNNGIYNHVSKASLSSNDSLGCSIINIDEVNGNSITVREMNYNEESDDCDLSSQIVFSVPCGAEKHEQNLFRTKIHEKVQIELAVANELLLIDETEESTGKDFLNLFNTPILNSNSTSGFESKVNSLPFNFHELNSNETNFVIIGKDKSGKTSLLKKLLLDYQINFSKNGIVPFYFDCKEIESKIDSKFTLNKLIASYYSLNARNVEKLLTGGYLRLLIDNFSQQPAVSDYLKNFLLNNPNVSYIICSDYNVTSLLETFSFGEKTYKKLFIHDITRKEITSYTEKHLLNKSNKEEIQDKIIQLCKQLELPLNYWTISLLLLIYKKSNNDYQKNIFEILDLCVDEVLNKKYLTLSRSRVGFDLLKRICADLASVLFSDYRLTTYSATQIEVVGIINKTIERNIRITADPNEIFNYLLSTGILKIKEDSIHYTFRLNGFFEYFLAFYMIKDDSFRDKIIEDEQLYLSFKNEFEIYSGYKRNDFDLLNKIFRKTQEKLSTIFEKYTEKDSDSLLLEKLDQPKQVIKKINKLSIQKSLSSEEISLIGDTVDLLDINSEVHEKAIVDVTEFNSDILERYLSVLARVYRNSDDILEHNFELDNIFDYLLESYCNLGFYIFDEFSDIIEKSEILDTEESDEIELLKIISSFNPLLSEIAFYDGIGHFNIETIINEKIEVYKKDTDKNQLKLFMLYFLLIDIDLKKHKNKIDELMAVVKMPVLKTTIFLKLNFYLAFKANGRSSLQKFLEDKIRLSRLNMDSSTDYGIIEKDINSTKKQTLMKKLL